MSPLTVVRGCVLATGSHSSFRGFGAQGLLLRNVDCVVGLDEVVKEEEASVKGGERKCVSKVENECKRMKMNAHVQT